MGAARPYELKTQSLKMRDQLLSFLLLLQHVSTGDGDMNSLVAEPGVDILRDSISEVRLSLSLSQRDSSGDIHTSGRSSFGAPRDSCSGRDSLTSVWDAKPMFRRSEANVGEDELEGIFEEDHPSTDASHIGASP